MKDYKNIDEYIGASDQKAKPLLKNLREVIKKASPTATETISYGIPTFKIYDKNLVHFGGFKTHIGFFPSPNGMEKFKTELQPYATGKGTAQFPLDKDLPEALISAIVKFRASEIEDKIKDK